jgi:hypothetical protein
MSSAIPCESCHTCIPFLEYCTPLQNGVSEEMIPYERHGQCLLETFFGIGRQKTHRQLKCQVCIFVHYSTLSSGTEASTLPSASQRVLRSECFAASALQRVLRSECLAASAWQLVLGSECFAASTSQRVLCCECFCYIFELHLKIIMTVFYVVQCRPLIMQRLFLVIEIQN